MTEEQCSELLDIDPASPAAAHYRAQGYGEPPYRCDAVQHGINPDEHFHHAAAGYPCLTWIGARQLAFANLG